MTAKPFADLGKREYDRLGEIYGEKWHARGGDEPLRAARIIIDYLRKFIQPASVLDVGCGRGYWLQAWRERGAELLVGLDGQWNSQESMTEPSIRFQAVDLNQPLRMEQKFDLAMTLEVAEHLQIQSGVILIESMVRMSDLVLFSAAYLDQGGRNHLNERPHSYWARLFAALDFVPLDVLRPVFWDDERIPFWYRQNCFLYARRGSSLLDSLVSQGLTPITNIGFMDCVHPLLYNYKVDLIRKLLRRVTAR